MNKDYYEVKTSREIIRETGSQGDCLGLTNANRWSKKWIPTNRLASRIIKQLKKDRSYDYEYLESEIKSAIDKVIRWKTIPEVPQR